MDTWRSHRTILNEHYIEIHIRKMLTIRMRKYLTNNMVDKQNGLPFDNYLDLSSNLTIHP